MGHYEERLDRDVERIRRRLERLGRGVIDALDDACRSLLSRNFELATETILGDLPINRRYRELDHSCHLFVARHLPSAGHLRFVSAVLRLGKTLERIGDYAETISRAALQLHGAPPERIAKDVEMMSRRSRQVLERSLKAFLDGDAAAARATVAAAGQYGTTFDKVFDDLVTEGERGSIPIRELFSTLAVFNRLERVIHQAKNICEQTIFAVTGETKHEKTFDILFIDEDNAGASLLAEHYCKKAYEDAGTFQSCGWTAATDVRPEFLEFAEARGLDLRNCAPRGFDAVATQIQDFEIMIDLSGKARENISRIPFHTILISWPVEDLADPECVFKVITPRLQDLVARLRGEEEEED